MTSPPDESPPKTPATSTIAARARGLVGRIASAVTAWVRANPRTALVAAIAITFAIVGWMRLRGEITEAERVRNAAIATDERTRARLAATEAALEGILDRLGIDDPRFPRVAASDPVARNALERTRDLYLARTTPLTDAEPDRLAATHTNLALAEVELRLGLDREAADHAATAAAGLPPGPDHARALLTGAIAQRRLGEAKEATVLGDQAITHAERWLATNPDDADALAVVARVWVERGDTAEHGANVPAAADAYRRALDAVAIGSATDPMQLACAGQAAMRLGALAAWQGRLEDARGHYDSAHVQLRTLASAVPHRRGPRRALVRVAIARARLALEGTDPTDGMRALVEAVAEARTHEAEWPDREATAIRAEALLALGEALADVDPKRADAALAEATTTLDALVARAPDVARFATNRAHAVIARAAFRLDRGDDATVIARQLRDGLRTLERLADDARTVADEERIAVAYHQLGRAQVALDDAEAASAALKLAIGRLDTLARQLPHVRRLRSRLADARLSRGDAFVALDRITPAIGAYDAAITELGRIATDSERPADRRALAAALARLGTIHARAGDLGRARSAIAGAFDAQRAVVDALPESNADRDMLADYGRRLAGTALALRDHRGVAEAMERLDESMPEMRLTQAGFFAAACGVAREDSAIGVGDRTRLANQYGSRAVGLLRKAFALGDIDLARLKALRRVLSPIENRDDFRQLITEMLAREAQRGERG